MRKWSLGWWWVLVVSGLVGCDHPGGAGSGSGLPRAGAAVGELHPDPDAPAAEIAVYDSWPGPSDAIAIAELAGDGVVTGDLSLGSDHGGGSSPDPSPAPPDAHIDGPAPDLCGCGGQECGVGPCGESCGVCGAGEVCVVGACVPNAGAAGHWCGPTEGCNSDTVDYPGCFHDQCDESLCLRAGVPGVVVFHPVCSRPCTLVKDEIVNATGVPGSDGVDDPDSGSEQCSGFAEGPAGSSFVCARFYGAGGEATAYCVPGQGFAACGDDSACPDGEGCFVTSLDGQLGLRCMSTIAGGEWGASADKGDYCDVATAGELTYCQSGYCSSNHCRAFCDGDSDCDAGSCQPPAAIFPGQSAFEASTCSPASCLSQSDCQAGFYCQLSANGLPYPEAAWIGQCKPHKPGGAVVGAPCDGDAACATGMCAAGACSAVCLEDSECGAGQICDWVDAYGDVDSNGLIDFILPFGFCRTLQGASSVCASAAACGPGQYCALTTKLVQDPDAPFQVQGVCVDQLGALGFGAPCQGSSECAGGYCVGNKSDGTPGYCTQLCAGADECPMTVAGFSGVPSPAAGVCRSRLYSYGGELSDPYVNTYAPLCVPVAGSGADCSDGFSCPPGEACRTNVIATSPDKPAAVEQRCEKTYGLSLTGAPCDPSSPNYCYQGYCEPGIGYCSVPCASDGDCITDYDMSCDNYSRYPRRGPYAPNSDGFGLCLKDMDCAQCLVSEQCPAGRVCVDLDGAGDFRCVRACESDLECVDGPAVACSPSVDPSGTVVKACFYPSLNHCD